MKRKFTDKYTGRLKKDKSVFFEPIPENNRIGGGLSRTTKFYAIIESMTYYKTEDDNYANFEDLFEKTPEFKSMDELKEYMNTNNIRIGSEMTRVVPINDGEHKVYKREVKVPITDISYRMKYSINIDAFVNLSHESDEMPGIEIPEYIGNLETAECDAHSYAMQSLYSVIKSENAKRNHLEECKVDVNEMLSVRDAMRLELSPETLDNTIEFLETKKVNINEKFVAKYDNMINKLKMIKEIKAKGL